MRYLFTSLILLLPLGCSDVAENPTAPAQYQTVPEPVLDIIRFNCAYCHQPDSNFFVFKGQKPYFRNWLPDSSETFLDTIVIWQSRERIGFRVADSSMPRNSDTTAITDNFFPLPPDFYDIIIDWSMGEY